MKSTVKIVLMPLGISMNKLALDLHLPAMRIQEIVHQASEEFVGSTCLAGSKVLSVMVEATQRGRQGHRDRYCWPRR
jgi:hypothetical protein